MFLLKAGLKCQRLCKWNRRHPFLRYRRWSYFVLTPVCEADKTMKNQTLISAFTPSSSRLSSSTGAITSFRKRSTC